MLWTISNRNCVNYFTWVLMDLLGSEEFCWFTPALCVILFFFFCFIPTVFAADGDRYVCSDQWVLKKKRQGISIKNALQPNSHPGFSCSPWVFIWTMLSYSNLNGIFMSNCFPMKQDLPWHWPGQISARRTCQPALLATPALVGHSLEMVRCLLYWQLPSGASRFLTLLSWKRHLFTKKIF